VWSLLIREIYLKCTLVVAKLLKKNYQKEHYPFCGLLLNRDHDAAIHIRVGDYDLSIKQIDTPHFSEGKALI
jgi:hypothetical protein